MLKIPEWIVIVVLLAIAGAIVYLACRFLMTVFLALADKGKEKLCEKDKTDEDKESEDL